LSVFANGDLRREGRRPNDCGMLRVFGKYLGGLSYPVLGAPASLKMGGVMAYSEYGDPTITVLLNLF
jgi:hypothetical protein